MAGYGPDEIMKLSPEVDWANKPVREILQSIAKKKKDKQYLQTLEMIDIEKIQVQLSTETAPKLRSLADLTPRQIKNEPEVLLRFLTHGDSAVQRLEFEARSKGNVVPKLLHITKNLDTVFTAADMGKKGGAVYLALKDMVDTESLERMTARGASTQTYIPKFIPDQLPKIAEAIRTINYDAKLGIYTDGGEARNIAALKAIGGYRNSDLARLDISSIDFNTGKISPTVTKAGLASGQLSDAALDIVRAQVGGNFDVNGRFIPNKTSGPLFDIKITTNAKGVKTYTLKSANKINRHLTKELGQIDAWSPYSQKWGKRNFTLGTFRHLNETMWGETFHFAKTPIRDMATLRPQGKNFDPSRYADPNFSPSVKKEANLVNAKFFGYLGHGTASDAMASFGYNADQISKETGKIIVGKDILKNEEFVNALNKGIVDPNNPKIKLVDKGFIDSLPDNSPVDGKVSKPIPPMVAEAQSRKRAAQVDLQTEKTKGLTLDQQMKNIEKEKNIKTVKDTNRLHNVLGQFNEKEYTLFTELKESLPDATNDDLIKIVKNKNSHEAFWNFLDNYKGVRRLAKLSKLFGGPAGILLTGGISTALYKAMSPVEAEAFDQPNDTIGGYLQEFFDLSDEEIKQKRLNATMALNIPIAGDIYEYGMSKIFPTTIERDYKKMEEDQKLAQEAFDIETDMFLPEQYPEHTMHAARTEVHDKYENLRLQHMKEENERIRNEIAEKNRIKQEELAYTEKKEVEDATIHKLIKNMDIDRPLNISKTYGMSNQTDKLFRPAIEAEEENENLIQ